MCISFLVYLSTVKKWRQILPKPRMRFTELHEIISQKIKLFLSVNCGGSFDKYVPL
jgi:hypothetical protein